MRNLSFAKFLSFVPKFKFSSCLLSVLSTEMNSRRNIFSDFNFLWQLDSADQFMISYKKIFVKNLPAKHTKYIY